MGLQGLWRLLVQTRPNTSQSGKPKRADDAFRDLPSALARHGPALAGQLFLWHGKNQVAFAKRFPIQAVSFIENRFQWFGLALRALAGAEENVDFG
jgi:hypothetical protein